METLYCHCGQEIICFHNVFSGQIEFLFQSPERPILWCPNCSVRLKYRDLHKSPSKRKPILIIVWHPVHALHRSAKRPWHVPYLEIHLMGICSSLFRDALSGEFYNRAVGIEWMYGRAGLIGYRSLN